MATRKQKEQLVKTLKFTPQTCRLMLQGYGGESYAGTVDRKIYDYFKKHEIDIEQYASEWDDLFEDVPADMQPFTPGSPYECDNLFHASGAEVSDLNDITVSDSDGNDIWSHSLGSESLIKSGIAIGESDGAELDDLEPGTVVFWGGNGEKGCFFDAEFTLREPFDPKKLRLYYDNCDGWLLITAVEYDGEELDGSGGYSTTGKWSENKWIITGDEEVYSGVERESQDDDDSEDESDDEPGVIYAECVQCSWRGPIDDTWMDEETGDMQCPECKEPVEIEDQLDESVSDLEDDLDELKDSDDDTWIDVDQAPEFSGPYKVTVTSSWPFPSEITACYDCDTQVWTDLDTNEVLTTVIKWKQ